MTTSVYLPSTETGTHGRQYTVARGTAILGGWVVVDQSQRNYVRADGVTASGSIDETARFASRAEAQEFADRVEGIATQWTTSPDPQDPALKRLHVNGRHVGYYSHSATTWFSCYTITNAKMAHDSMEDAISWIVLQHEVAQHVARSVRSVRPASARGGDAADQAWTNGYNSALKDIEAVLRSYVGPAQRGEGYTAITGEH